jgi:hypothetical protein
MMVELWTTKRTMVNEDESDMEDTTGYKKSGVWLASLSIEEAWLGLGNLVWVLVPAGSELISAVLGMVYWLTHEYLTSYQFSDD